MVTVACVILSLLPEVLKPYSIKAFLRFMLPLLLHDGM